MRHNIGHFNKHAKYSKLSYVIAVYRESFSQSASTILVLKSWVCLRPRKKQGQKIGCNKQGQDLKKSWSVRVWEIFFCYSKREEVFSQFSPFCKKKKVGNETLNFLKFLSLKKCQVDLIIQILGCKLICRILYPTQKERK